MHTTTDTTTMPKTCNAGDSPAKFLKSTGSHVTCPATGREGAPQFLGRIAKLAALCVTVIATHWYQPQPLSAQSSQQPKRETARRQGEPLHSDSGISLRDRAERAIDATTRRYLSTNDHDPWQIVHGIKAFGWQFELKDSRTNQKVNAIDFLFGDSPGSRSVFVPGELGLKVRSGPGLEGHPNQFLSAIAQAGTPLDHPISVGGRRYTLEDLLKQSQYDYYRGQESSWTLIAFSTYMFPDETWSNRQGETFGIEDLVAQEVAVEPTKAACGGTHNLYALAYALNRHREEGGAVTDAWQRAEDKLERYYRMTQTLQNEDGYCSANFYAGPGHSSDPTTQLNTTGHTLEWLTIYLSSRELEADWAARAIDALLRSFERTSDQPVECGSLYHATRAIVQYRQGVFGVPSGLLAAVPRRPIMW